MARDSTDIDARISRQLDRLTDPDLTTVEVERIKETVAYLESLREQEPGEQQP